MANPRAITRLSSAALLAVASASGAAVSATSHRPHHAQPAPIARDTDPETTAAIPSPPKPPATVPKADDGTLPPPFRLPSASRARVRDCGLKWQAMKMSGEAGDDIWRDFAPRCLTAANGPFEKR